MKILKVIHGYPMRYNAGSEVYSQTLCHGLTKKHEVHVFTREEDSFALDFRLRVEQDQDCPDISVHLVNNPRHRDRYREAEIDNRFSEVLEEINPDIVHIGHLSHLSTSLIKKASDRKIPLIFTLHDYWLMCPRGQFMQMFPECPHNLWETCEGQQDQKCAQRCYARYYSGASEELETDMKYWTDWVSRRMKHIREMTELVDMFIAPSRYLYNRYCNDFHLPESKMFYLDYGFAKNRMNKRCRKQGEPFTFGYIGTHIPAKGIHDLIRAFGKLKGNSRLKIWGRPRGQDTEALRNIASTEILEGSERIEWLWEYKNQNIISDVFNQCDAIVVPSIWVENSPLVIHEAQQARVPIITANAGGMAEYVHHEVNGLLFEHRSVDALAAQMQRFADEPEFANLLGARGYLYTDNGDIPDIDEHVRQIERIYENLLARYKSSKITPKSGPWRITFDTNPDSCNSHCIMCEEHSPYNQRQKFCKTDGHRQRIMNFEIIEQTIADAVPYGLKEIIPSTMGEPLLYERFEDLVDLCHRYNLKLNLTTNGTFPRLGVERWANIILPVASDVKISWNGATKTTYESIMLGNKWEKSLNNLKEFIRIRDNFAAKFHRSTITLQVTFLESNVDELAEIVRLAIDLGVDRIKGHHLWVHFDEIREQSMRRNTKSIERWNQIVEKVHIVSKEKKLSNGKYIHLENIFKLSLHSHADIAPENPCPFLGKEAWVSAEGRFNPCCAPDAMRRTLGEFGNLYEQGLIDIWNSNQYKELVSGYGKNELCLNCNMRKPIKDN